MGERAYVNKIIPFSAVDGPGNRTAVFLQGCNFNCQYCHNPETRNMCRSCGTCVKECPAEALQIRNGKVTYHKDLCILCDRCIQICPHGASPRVLQMCAEEVLAEIKKQVPFIRGVTVSGGECTLYSEFLTELFTLVKGIGLTTLIDTNGTLDFRKAPELLAVTDGIMLDIKAFDPEEHKTVTSCHNKLVLENAVYLAKIGKLHEVRTVVSPGLFDCENTVRQTSNLLVPYLKKRNIAYKIIQYRPMGVRKQYAHLQAPSKEYLQHLKEIALAIGFQNVIIT